ncbi:MAG: hypothetical protein UW22_C0083G0003 [Candidatus Gottesmanbacteria bacterium GW2011_GWB1_44_11c]|uniref:Uncharacterized protein n=1 Tax=Candidatus Gottesmanbacteria bacterium GW2011_GWB1_44_11c TaxID=1618447 RepID=A0A0G1JFR8_9BACT|nr:MAG: hypothetical protein UW22_C0083G0003 [Candidatus Gottesmanbacteria bacterium GW2011_GWB1_44_11c]
MDESKEGITIQPASAEVPASTDSLPREFREVPGGYVSVFIAVPREKADEYGKEGIKIKNNAMKSKQPVLERIFDEEAGKIGVGVGRTRCIFAYPRNPESIHNRLGFDPRTDILVEAMINSETAMVANAEYYTEAASRLDMGENAAREWAKIYWQEVKPLRQYLAEGHSGSEDDDSDFAFPEVLIPEDIPVTRLRIAKVQPET